MSTDNYIKGLVERHASEIEALTASKIAIIKDYRKLRDALLPFAQIGARLNDDVRDHDSIPIPHGRTRAFVAPDQAAPLTAMFSQLHFGWLRRAATVFRELGDG